MLYMIVFFLFCGDSMYSELLTRCNHKIPFNVHFIAYPHKYQTTNNDPVYSIHCGQNVKVTRYTLNDC